MIAFKNDEEQKLWHATLTAALSAGHYPENKCVALADYTIENMRERQPRPDPKLAEVRDALHAFSAWTTGPETHPPPDLIEQLDQARITVDEMTRL